MQYVHKFCTVCSVYNGYCLLFKNENNFTNSERNSLSGYARLLFDIYERVDENMNFNLMLMQTLLAYTCLYTVLYSV